VAERKGAEKKGEIPKKKQEGKALGVGSLARTEKGRPMEFRFISRAVREGKV